MSIMSGDPRAASRRAGALTPPAKIVDPVPTTASGTVAGTDPLIMGRSATSTRERSPGNGGSSGHASATTSNPRARSSRVTSA
jgi:hypothetical protein